MRFMKALLYSPVLLLLLTFFFAPEMVRAQDNSGDQDVSFQVFYDQLGDEGTWIQTDNYGYVFQPNVSDPNWAPYTDGHWVSTDEGWTWVTDEPWGWATYHYGRWANIDGTGWVWVPGYRWGPAWVSWRYGGGYCGWAPLPPESLAGGDYGDQGGEGYHYGDDVDISFNIGAGCYNFLPVGDMGESNYRGRFTDRGNNYRIINNTRNVTNINVSNAQRGGGHNFGGVTAGGPSLSKVNAHSRQHVQTAQLTQARQAGASALHGNSLAVFAPRVAPAVGQQARPARVGQTLSQPTFNRGDSITKPLEVTARVKAPAPTQQAIETARQAEANAPAAAKVVREKTPVNSSAQSDVRPTMSPDRQPAPSSEINPNSGQPSAPYHGATAPRSETPSKPALNPQPDEVRPQQQEQPQEHQPLKPESQPRPQAQEQPQEHQPRQSEPQPRPQAQEQPQQHQQQQPQSQPHPQAQEQPQEHQQQPSQPQAQQQHQSQQQPHPQAPAQQKQNAPQQQPAHSSSSNSGH
jgi:hypothetical protein